MPNHDVLNSTAQPSLRGTVLDSSISVSEVTDRPECAPTTKAADTSLNEFATAEQSRSQTPTEWLADDELPAPLVRQGHLLLIANQRGATLRNRPCTGIYVNDVFMLHKDGLYQHGKRVVGETNPLAEQLRRPHRVDYANRCVERKCQQPD